MVRICLLVMALGALSIAGGSLGLGGGFAVGGVVVMVIGALGAAVGLEPAPRPAPEPVPVRQPRPDPQ
jgi:hypothetical protein